MRAKSNKATRQAAKARKAIQAAARAEATRDINKANKKESIKTIHHGKQPDSHVMVIRNEQPSYQTESQAGQSAYKAKIAAQDAPEAARRVKARKDAAKAAK